MACIGYLMEEEKMPEFEYQEPTQDLRNLQETEHERRHAEELQDQTSVSGVEDIAASARYNILGSAKDDSETWRDARQRMQDLFRLLNSDIDTVPVTAVRQQYQAVIKSCDDYLNAHKGFRWTSVGRKRKQMMQDARDLAVVENSGIVEALSARRASGVTGGRWTELVANIRTEKVDLAGVHTDVTGGQTSEVLTWGPAGQRTFFKDKEMILTLNQYIENSLAAFEATSDVAKDYTAKLQMLPPLNADSINTITMMVSNVMQQTELSEKRRFFTDNYAILLRELRCTPELINELTHTFEQNDNILTGPLFDFFVSISKNYVKGIVADKAGISIGSELSCRNTATSRMADLLGVSGIVARSRTIEVIQGEKRRIGNGMKQAKGTDFDHLDPELQEALEICPAYLHELNKLKILDYICGQIDRHTGNYFVDAEMIGEGEERHLVFRSITGIDNDLAFGTLHIDEPSGVKQLEQLVDSRGNFMLQTADRDLCESILALTPEVVAYHFCDLLSTQELSALMYRVKKLYTAVSRLSEDRKVPPPPPDDEHPEE
jgi:hypothetical protein